MKCNVRVLMLMLLMCWASQSLAQPTRADLISKQLFKKVSVCTITDKFSNIDLTEDKHFDDGAKLIPQDYVAEAFPKASYDVDIQASIEAAKVDVITQPLHGKLVFTDGFYYRYTPNEGYVGNDKVEFLVTVENHNVKVSYHIKTVGTEITLSNFSKLFYKNCGKNSYRTSSSADGDNINITFRDLTGAAVGETTGEGANATITLDTNAAGYSWYEGGMFNMGDLSLNANFNSSLSPTLSQGARGLNDISNWLPTSNPNEWVARAGTAAEGKMDMLSVLLFATVKV